MMFVVPNLVMMTTIAQALRKYLGMTAPILIKCNVLTNVHFKIPMPRERRLPRKWIGQVR